MSGRPARWRSGAVNLALVGAAGGLAAGLGGCSKAGYQRNVYKSMADCIADYSATDCSSKGQQGAGVFLGPTYRVVGGSAKSCVAGDPGPGPLHFSRKSGTQVERNGFGVACRSGTRSSGSGSGYRFWGG